MEMTVVGEAAVSYEVEIRQNNWKYGTLGFFIVFYN